MSLSLSLSLALTLGCPSDQADDDSADDDDAADDDDSADDDAPVEARELYVPDPGDDINGLAQTIVDGHPAIAWTEQDEFGGDAAVMYLRADDAEGSSWSDPVTVASLPDGGAGPLDLVEVGGLPLVIVGGGAPRWTTGGDAAGGSWSPLDDLDPALSSCAAVRARVMGDHLALAYAGSGAGSGMRYLRSTDLPPSGWHAPVDVDLGADAGSTPSQLSSIEIVQGRPAVAYIAPDAQLWGDYLIRYLRADDAEGATWSPPQAVYEMTWPDGVVDHVTLRATDDDVEVGWYAESWTSDPGELWAATADGVGGAFGPPADPLEPSRGNYHTPYQRHTWKIGDYDNADYEGELHLDVWWVKGNLGIYMLARLTTHARLKEPNAHPETHQGPVQVLGSYASSQAAVKMSTAYYSHDDHKIRGLAVATFPGPKAKLLDWAVDPERLSVPNFAWGDSLIP